MPFSPPATSVDANFQGSLDYLYGLQVFGIKLGLDNIRALLKRLGHPELTFSSVHVAGSNGKGSVCATLAEILSRAGHRTGLYTSPHLHAFSERIRVEGRAIAETEVARLTAEIRSVVGELPVTFFEFTTAMALLHFARREVAWAVLETGMGGRLDATNAVTPRLAVITSLCRDHTRHLGADLATIAAEKAGIIKAGVPVVCAPQEPEALAVIETLAAELGSPFYLAGRDFSVSSCPDGGFAFAGLGLALGPLTSGLPGVHQHLNQGLAIAAAVLLRQQGLALPETALQDGVAAVRWPGRLEWWAGGREILLDGAHNEGGSRVLAAYLAELSAPGIRWVVGVKGDKDLDGLLAPLLPQVTAVYCTVPPVEAAAEPEALAAAAVAAGRPARSFPSAAAALTAALADRLPGEVVLVAGSLYLVAAAREFLMNLTKVEA